MLHGVPIFVSLLSAMVILSLDAFNPNMTCCYIGPDPTCEGSESKRSYGDADILFGVFSVGPYVVLPFVIVSTMSIIYQAVLLQEKTRTLY